MTITIGFATVADSIAGISVSGVTMKDIDQIPETAEMLCPIMFPQPDNFITNVQVTRMSFGAGGTAKLDLSYSMNYVYLQSEVGSGISAFSAYAGMIANIATIVKAILTNDNITGAVDLEMESIGDLGVIADPANNEYWGTLLSVKVLEHAQ